jgi:hypothetical protein
VKRRIRVDLKRRKKDENKKMTKIFNLLNLDESNGRGSPSPDVCVRIFAPRKYFTK